MDEVLSAALHCGRAQQKRQEPQHASRWKALCSADDITLTWASGFVGIS